MASIKDSFTADRQEVSHEEKAVSGPEVIASTLEAAGQKPNPFGPGHVQLYLFCVIIYFCSTMNGMLISIRVFVNSTETDDVIFKVTMAP
jgi:hypothetical protein